MNLGFLMPCETSAKNFSEKMINGFRSFTINPAYELTLIFKGNKNAKVKEIYV